MRCPKCGYTSRTRSIEQNAYWWGVIIPEIAEASGFTHDEAHEALKAKFLGQDDLATGLRRIGSTARLDTKQFTDLIDQVRQWALDFLNCYIPAPNEPV